MASNPITDMNDWKHKERKQKRAREANFLKPHGRIYHKREPEYNRDPITSTSAEKIMATQHRQNIVNSIRPEITITRHHTDTGEDEILIHRDFNTQPITAEELEELKKLNQPPTLDQISKVINTPREIDTDPEIDTAAKENAETPSPEKRHWKKIVKYGALGLTVVASIAAVGLYLSKKA